MICRSDGVAHVRRRVALVATVAVTPFSVERECDPPASASGRRGLRPSRDTWRWRPRHRICLPAAATSCVGNWQRSRQARPSRAMHDGEGAPLLRPHARLTSFGGYVATGGTRFIASAPVPPLGRNKCDPPAAHYHLPTTIYHLPTTLYQLRAQMGGCQFTSE